MNTETGDQTMKSVDTIEPAPATVLQAEPTDISLVSNNVLKPLPMGMGKQSSLLKTKSSGDKNLKKKGMLKVGFSIEEPALNEVKDSTATAEATNNSSHGNLHRQKTE